VGGDQDVGAGRAALAARGGVAGGGGAGVANAVQSETPPKYSRARAGSRLDLFKDWICEQLPADPTIQAQRLRELATELGYEGGKTIFDDYVREVRPRYRVRRTFERTIYRPGELVHPWEPASRSGSGTVRRVAGGW
jgi:hypothetical protein